MPTLFVPEDVWGGGSWRANHPLLVQAQISHGLREAGYGYWGFSPANTPEGGYAAYGVDAIGMNPDGYPSNEDNTLVDHGFAGCPGRDPKPDPPPSASTNGVVTPHAAFLALRWAPAETLGNLARLARDFDIYTRWGFRDLVNVQTGVVSDSYLSLDQGIIMAAIGNALGADLLRRLFVTGGFQRPAAPARRGGVQRRPSPPAWDAGSCTGPPRSLPRAPTRTQTLRVPILGRHRVPPCLVTVWSSAWRRGGRGASTRGWRAEVESAAGSAEQPRDGERGAEALQGHDGVARCPGLHGDHAGVAEPVEGGRHARRGRPAGPGSGRPAATSPRRSRHSAPASATRSPWTPSPPSCWPWSTRPCSPRGHRCGCAREDRRTALPTCRFSLGFS
jgi:hypothetical protein